MLVFVTPEPLAEAEPALINSLKLGHHVRRITKVRTNGDDSDL